MIGIALHGQADEPFKEIPNIKSHEQQFDHLACVNLLMANNVRGDYRKLTAKEQSHDVDGIIVLGRQ